MKLLLAFILSFFPRPSSTPTPTYIPAPTPSFKYALPAKDFLSRITKKPFGIYVTPKHSPVSPERFTGYHTGADAEYGDVATDVPVYAIDSGTIIYSGYVSGYGGFIAIQNANFISVYGHLRPSSLLTKGTQVTQGQHIAILGQGFTSETNGERKHLHLGIIKSTHLDFRGYVQQQSQLSLWQNPVGLFDSN